MTQKFLLDSGGTLLTTYAQVPSCYPQLAVLLVGKWALQRKT